MSEKGTLAGGCIARVQVPMLNTRSSPARRDEHIYIRACQRALEGIWESPAVNSKLRCQSRFAVLHRVAASVVRASRCVQPLHRATPINVFAQKLPIIGRMNRAYASRAVHVHSCARNISIVLFGNEAVASHEKHETWSLIRIYTRRTREHDYIIYVWLLLNKHRKILNIQIRSSWNTVLNDRNVRRID